jgi:hypothetical protein
VSHLKTLFAAKIIYTLSVGAGGGRLKGKEGSTCASDTLYTTNPTSQYNTTLSSHSESSEFEPRPENKLMTETFLDLPCYLQERGTVMPQVGQQLFNPTLLSINTTNRHHTL